MMRVALSGIVNAGLLVLLFVQPCADGVTLAAGRLDSGFALMDFNLVMFREDGSKRVFTLDLGSSTVGRKDDCNIRIPLAVVSRHHAEITLADTGAVLKDLGSANGTYLNNERVEEEDVEAGDQIMIGPVVFIVQVDGKPGDDDLLKIRSRASAASKGRRSGVSVGTSGHVAASDDDVDPIAALEALASSADQTAIHPEEDE